ncbi:hypothetical protein BO99DRAFT_20287 [Aspergillus violaceofuscus CBS 115571]|uniref:Uncharacterized protein n=1 Tax=Aspergillus violaceofuscus (strain CBS 115571) TaxID=1450538 RepID=A0A2V5HDE0_ASPV1|nr:hypothetical protein BO99DRAFT_20287 [Aspergillus violaceofuscus CBS 115571]
MRGCLLRLSFTSQSYSEIPACIMAVILLGISSTGSMYCTFSGPARNTGSSFLARYMMWPIRLLPEQCLEDQGLALDGYAGCLGVS